MIDNSKLIDSIKSLEHALSFKKKVTEDAFYFAGIVKSFETCLEYSWKYLKAEIESSGLEAYSPRDAIKRAGQLKLIENVEKWLSFFRGYHVVTNKNNITIQGEWYYIHLRNRISENVRGEKFDKIIVDKIIPDEIPEDVKNYLLNSSIFEGNEELYNDTIIRKGENK